MNKITLANQIESFILDGISFNYSKQIADVVFLSGKGKLNQTSYNLNKNITISGIYPEMVRERFRLPQTRIYYTLIQNEKLKIQHIEFQNDNIVIFSVASGKRKIKIEIDQDHKNYVLATFEKEIRNSALTEEFTVARNEIIWITDNAKMKSMDLLMDHLRMSCNREISIHPIQQISTRDRELMIGIDECWANLPCVDKNRDIDKKISEKNFIWLQELYLYFGWYAELSSFYESGIALRNTGKEDDEDLTEKVRRRFAVIQGVQNKIESEERHGFFDSYMSGNPQDNVQLNDRLQSYWERISKPALKSYFEQSFVTNPHEIIGFAMLAADCHCWWAEAAGKKILNFMAQSGDDTFKSIIKLLFSLKFGLVNIGLKSDGIHFTAMTADCGYSEVTMTKQNVCFKTNRDKAEVSTTAKQDGVFSLRVNKNTQIQYQEAKKLLKIDPVVFEDPQSLDSQNYIQLESSNIVLRVPLVWREFVVNLNGNRFKFLLKKDRYQVSVKKNLSEKALKLNGEKIFFENSLYQKVYLNIKKRPGRSYIQIYDQAGARIRMFGPHVKKIVARGHGYDMMGTLVEEFQIKSNQSSGSSRIFTNSINPQAIDVSTSELHLIFRAKKCLPEHVDFPKTEGHIWRLLQTDSDLLRIQLAFFIQNYSDKKHDHLVKFCLKYLGFYPRIRRLDELTHSNTPFAVIVGSHITHENEIKYDGFSSILMKEAGNKRIIYVEENRLDYFLKNFPEPVPEHTK